ncbi:MAG: serine hydrolase [Pseudomonadota bacterium]
MVAKIFRYVLIVFGLFVLAGVVFVGMNFSLLRNLVGYDPMAVWEVESQSPTALVKGAPRGVPAGADNDESAFDSAIAEWAASGGEALIVWRGGEIVLERYAGRGSADAHARSFSMHKSVVGLVAALMAENGLVDLDAPVAALLPEFAEDERGALTLRALLQHRTGFERYSMAPPTLKSLNLLLSDKIEQTALSSDIDSDPSVFDYANVNYQVAGAVLRRVLREQTQKSYAEYLSENIWQKIGAGDANLWLDSPQGAPRFYAGLQASPHDWLRLGILIAQGGEFFGQQVIPPGAMDTLTEPAVGEPRYGLGVWLGVPEDGPRLYGPSTALSIPNDGAFAYDDVIFMDGFGGQRVMISPSKQTVIVRIGEVRLDWNDTRLFNLVAATLDSDYPIEPATVSETTTISTTGGRSVTVRSLASLEICSACPPILFSHGAFSTIGAYDAVLEPLARAGHRVLIPQHVDAADHPERESYAPEDWLLLRLEDSQAVINQMIAPSADDWIAAGHSFGALVAQILGGAEHPSRTFIEDIETYPVRVIALSPPGLVADYIERDIFAAIKSPMLVVTGTDDIVPMFAENWCDHLVSHEEAAAGVSSALVFDGKDHYFDGLYGRINERAPTEEDDLLIDALVEFANNGGAPAAQVDYESACQQ